MYRGRATHVENMLANLETMLAIVGPDNVQQTHPANVKQALQKEIESNINKKMVLFITEGIVNHRGIYLNGKRIGTVTSSINSPNVSLEKREFNGSRRKNVLDKNGTAAIGLGWVSSNPFEVDKEGKDVLENDGKAVRIKLEFYREDEEKNLKETRFSVIFPEME